MDADRPQYALNWYERAFLGVRHRRLEDLERLGGLGTGASTFFAALFVGCCGLILSDIATSSAGSIRILIAVFVFALVASIGVLCIQMNRSGVIVAGSTIIIRNPWREVEIPAARVVRVSTAFGGLQVAIVLDDGTSVTIWGLGWWGSLNTALTAAADRELEYRITAARRAG